jgi:2-polyprenyl-3-methyl-5-hydroxy-6-metoxy-1,4-benzoquinol methylase
MLRKLFRKIIGRKQQSGPASERESDFYDAMYVRSEEHRKKYWQSRYYFLWTVIGDRLRSSKCGKLLDIGCGSGQFAEFVWNTKCLKHISYVGLDFSEEAIRQANAKPLTGMRFVVGDALNSNVLDELEYDSVVCMEVLEHIENDHGLLNRIRPGVRCLCTVPNFPFRSHVRHFKSEQEVFDRYSTHFEFLDVWGLAGSHREGIEYFLFDGVNKRLTNRFDD